MTTTPDADELETRARLMKLGVSYAPVPDDQPAEEDRPERTAPAAEEEPSAPAAGHSTPRLPHWWSSAKPDLSVKAPDGEKEQILNALFGNTDDQAEFRRRIRELLDSDLARPGEADEAEAPEPDEDQEEPELTQEDTTSERPGLRDRVRTWVEAVEERTGHRPAPEQPGEDTKEAEDAGEEDTGDTAENGGPGPGAPVSKKPPARWAGGRFGRAQKPRHWHRLTGARLPTPMKGAQERRSLVEVIRNTPDHVRWMWFSGSALCAGFYLGWPQWVADGVNFLVTNHPTLTDTYSVSCYGLAVAVFVLDARASALTDVRRGRWLVLPIAWLARIPTVSLVVGVPLSGNTTPISQMF
ncbi:hypothetical protein [Streptomyces alfalfae]